VELEQSSCPESFGSKWGIGEGTYFLTNTKTKQRGWTEIVRGIPGNTHEKVSGGEGKEEKE